MTSPTFLIHHISDVHIGSAHFKSDSKLSFVPSSSRPRNVVLYEKHLENCQESDLPDIVICSGDLTSWASEEEMNAATDFIRNCVGLLKRKQPEWRTKRTKPAPYFFMVPGNHDLDWTKESYHEKVSRFARMSDAVYNNGEVLSSHYLTKGHPVYFDFGEEVNVFIYLLDTTSLGGVNDPSLNQIWEELKAEHSSSALNKLQHLIRKDPGYVSIDDLDEMMAAMKQSLVPNCRLKIAVMHHNPTTVPSDNIEAYDSIINAGPVKSKLSAAGFDLLLHGHRHIATCTHERSLDTGDEWRQGFFIIGAGAMGSSENAPFLEMQLSDADKAHEAFPPATLLELRKVEFDGVGNHVRAPFVREAIHRKMYMAVGDILRRLGRTVDANNRQLLLQSIRSILPHMQRLQSSLVGWGEGSTTWIEKFHFQLGKYSRIYATDVQQRESHNTGRFDNYLREQYRARLERLRRLPDKRLLFSPEVVEAIQRTGWRPDPIQWSGYVLGTTDSLAGTLEIVRVVVRQRDLAESNQELEKLDFDHKMFAIPLFVLSPDCVDHAGALDFALGYDREGGLLRAFEFKNTTGDVEEVGIADRGMQLENTFKNMLKKPALQSVDEFLNYRPMIKQAARRGQFAADYDKTRRANRVLIRLLQSEFEGRKGRGLEIGCGTGNYTVPFENHFSQLVGLDVNDEMLEIARKKSARIEWKQANALNNSLPVGSFDAIWMISSLHYFKDVHLDFLFHESYRLLGAGGVFVADTEFAEQHESLWVVEYFPSLRERYRNACLPREEFRSLLVDAGFSDIRFEHFDYDPADGDESLRAGQREPQKYLDPEFRGGIPAFREMSPDELESGLASLRKAIANRSIKEVRKAYADRATMPGDIGVIIARR